MRKTTFVVAAGAALALVLTGCGAKSDNGTASPTGAKPELGLAAPFSNVIELAAASKQGTQKSKSSKMSMEMTSAGKTVTAQGEAAYGAQGTTFHMTVNADGEQTEMILVDNATYLKIPADQATQLGTDKPWLKISPDGDDPISKALAGSMAQAGQQSDPTQLLDQLSEAGKIVSSDQTEVDGQKANHYKVDIDMVKALDKLLKAAPEATKAKLKEEAQGKNIRIPMEIWVDKNQLPLQISMDESEMVKEMGGNAASAGTGKFVVKYSDWGAPVTIAAPPADQVADMGELIKKMGG
ncbi:hypothetical protein AB0878_13940 [Amycolatopsis sp. NPDC047767]|uniref:hypothetical protein n=1 Tax=Amycolatopsis sp. NPDC047767 TaxID=3156765 RepID=UPI003451E1D9